MRDDDMTPAPKLSIVVIFHNMQREARRTLYTLAPPYQTGVELADYEVIAIDSGSTAPLDVNLVEEAAPNARYVYHETDSVSPVGAVNRGAQLARGEYVAIIVDGARMASPGIVSTTLRALRMFDQPAVGGLAWHLGPDVQNRSMLDGYDQRREDELLTSVDWRANGYRLFEISTLAQSSSMGFLGGMPGELSWIALRADTFNALGGFENRFQSPGGGLVNQDFRNRLMGMPEVTPVVLLGEGVFHQFHGGVATNVPMERHPLNHFHAEYEKIVGEPFKPVPTANVVYHGTMPDAARRFIRRD
jgi:glycosyltransferase involved in cell wall biosynthesis